jgi:nucleoside-diphosphate-sugar epimerase
MEQTSEPKRVLVTGSTGAIGAPLCQYLQQRGHIVRGFARRPSTGLDDYIMGDLNDREKVRTAAENMDVIIHLGAYPNPADFVDVLLQPNVVGTYNICEAAVEFGVKRLVLASTVQVISGHLYPGSAYIEGRTVSVEDGPAPKNHYALTKAWAETAGEMYARVHRLSVISVRIGWLPRNREEADALRSQEIGPDIFLSHDDSNRFHARCVESPNPAPGQSVILHATSIPARFERMDLGPARRIIGYKPQDVWPQGLPFDVES